MTCAACSCASRGTPYSSTNLSSTLASARSQADADGMEVLHRLGSMKSRTAGYDIPVTRIPSQCDTWGMLQAAAEFREYL